jgi:hypothetical protein
MLPLETLIEQLDEISLGFVCRSQFARVFREVAIAAKLTRQLPYFFQKTQSLLVSFVILPLEHGLDLALVNGQGIFGMFYFALGGEFQPQSVRAAAFLSLPPCGFYIPLPEKYPHELGTVGVAISCPTIFSPFAYCPGDLPAQILKRFFSPLPPRSDLSGMSFQVLVLAQRR